MSAKRVTTSAIDWVAFVARVPKHQKPDYASFKGKCDSYLRNVVALPETLPKIHWDQYKTRIAVPGMVDEFQKQYEALKIPYPADTYTDAINAKEKAVMEEVKEFCKESNTRIASHEKELKRWENMIPITEMTLEEFAEEFPDLAINLDKPTFWPHTPEAQLGYVPEGGEEQHGH